MKRFAIPALALLLACLSGVATARAASPGRVVPFTFVATGTYTLAPCTFGMVCATLTASGTFPGVGTINESGTVIANLPSIAATGCSDEYGSVFWSDAQANTVRLDLNGRGCAGSQTAYSDDDVFTLAGTNGSDMGTTGWGRVHVDGQATSDTTFTYTATYTGWVRLAAGS